MTGDDTVQKQLIGYGRVSIVVFNDSDAPEKSSLATGAPPLNKLI